MSGSNGSTGARRDELLLRTPCDVEEQDDLRLGRIHDEIERGFDALRDIDDGVTIFGSARIGEGRRWYELCREISAWCEDPAGLCCSTCLRTSEESWV